MIVVDTARVPEKATKGLPNADPDELLTEADREAAAEVLGFGTRTMASAWYLTALLVRLDRL